MSTDNNPNPYPYYQQVPQPQPQNGLGTAGMVLGIIAVVFSPIPGIGFFGLILGILAIVFGAVGGHRVKRGAANNRGVARAGLVLGVIAVVVSTLAWYAFATAVDSELDKLNDEYGSEFESWDEVDEVTDGMDAWADCVNRLDVYTATDYDYARCNALLEE